MYNIVASQRVIDVMYNVMASQGVIVDVMVTLSASRQRFQFKTLSTQQLRHEACVTFVYVSFTEVMNLLLRKYRHSDTTTHIYFPPSHIYQM